MKRDKIEIYEARFTDEPESLTIIQICDRCKMSKEEFLELIEEGIVYPESRHEEIWNFSYEALERIQKAKRLKRDLELTIHGVALAMSLLDRIDELEKEIRKIKM